MSEVGQMIAGNLFHCSITPMARYFPILDTGLGAAGWEQPQPCSSSGEEQCTPHYMVPVSPQCSQEIVLPTLPVFQGTAFSTRKRSATGRLVTSL